MNLKSRIGKFRAKKSLGQNFLISEEHINKIASTLNKEKSIIVEIGAGLGFLTEKLLAQGSLVYALDYDLEALSSISNHENLKKIHADILNFNLNFLEKEFFIAGNLPFNIGTKILLKIIGGFENINWEVFRVEEMILMFQLEVAQRLTAKVGSKAHNSLSLLMEAKTQCEFLFEVNSNCFYPAPKVKGGVIRIKKNINPSFAELDLTKRKLLERIIRQAFSTKRKTLRNSLKSLLKDSDFEELNILPNLRAEDLSLEQFISIAKFIN